MFAVALPRILSLCMCECLCVSCLFVVGLFECARVCMSVFVNVCQTNHSKTPPQQCFRHDPQHFVCVYGSEHLIFTMKDRNSKHSHHSEAAKQPFLVSLCLVKVKNLCCFLSISLINSAFMNQNPDPDPSEKPLPDFSIFACCI